jgi:uncharacterized membrane protein
MASVNEDKSIVRELGKRRVFIFFSIAIAIVFAVDAILVESDNPTFMLDDFGLVGLSILSLAFLAVWRNRRSLKELRSQHNIIAALFVIAVLFKIYGIAVETGHSEDFGNEIPGLIILLIVVLNRYV